MSRTDRRTIVGAIGGIVGCLVVLPAGIAMWMAWATRRHRFTVAAQTPRRPAAVVLGAGLRSDGRPTMILEDRLRTAVELYEAGQVARLLLSGGRNRYGHDEATVMAAYCRDLGIPTGALIEDHGGSRTIDTCRSAARLGFKACCLVSQAYHLPRAVYIARRLGLDAVGVAADRRSYRGITLYRLREIAAATVAWVELVLRRSS